jgi:AcrR family transcriptional regulator
MSADESPDESPDERPDAAGETDLTARARIRDSALRLFGRDGYDGTSVRLVASAAGVSAGLVIHHFGSKEGLRRACDEYVVRMIAEKAELETKPSASVIQELLSDVESFGPAIDYLARMLVEDSPAAERLFDLLFQETRAIYREGVRAGTMNASSDEDLLALLLLTGGLAPLLLRRHLTRLVGAEYLSPAFLNRLMIPTLELYTNGLYADDTMLTAARQLAAGGRREDTPP